MLHFYILTGLIDGAGPVAVEPPAVTPTKAGGGGKAFRVKDRRQASPYRDTREAAAELQTRASVVAESSDISAPAEAPKPEPIKAETREKKPDILADISAQAAASSVMAQALAGVEAQLRKAIEQQEMDEDEAVALILILAEA